MARAWLGSDNYLLFDCPGCQEVHAIPVNCVQGENGSSWQWNGSLDRPTTTPSILIRYPANPEAAEEFKEWRSERVCHSFIRDGQIQFLNDCTHGLNAQTVDLPEVE